MRKVYLVAVALLCACYAGLDASSTLTSCLEARDCMEISCRDLAEQVDASPDNESLRAQYNGCVTECGGLRTDDNCLDGRCDHRRQAFRAFEECNRDELSANCNQLLSACYEFSQGEGYGLPPHCLDEVDEPEDGLCEWAPYERSCEDFHELIIPVCSPHTGMALQTCIADKFVAGLCDGLRPDSDVPRCQNDRTLAALTAYACVDPSNARVQQIVIELEEAGIPIPSTECDAMQAQCLD